MAGSVKIKGFTRKDGVKVKGYTRKAPARRKKSSRLGSKAHLSYLKGERRKGRSGRRKAITRTLRKYQRKARTRKMARRRA